MRDEKMSSIQLMDYMQKQLPYENDARNFQAAAGNLKNIKIAYLPVDSRDVYGKKIYNTLMQIMEEPKKS